MLPKAIKNVTCQQFNACGFCPLPHILKQFILNSTMGTHDRHESRELLKRKNWQCCVITESLPNWGLRFRENWHFLDFTRLSHCPPLFSLPVWITNEIAIELLTDNFRYISLGRDMGVNLTWKWGGGGQGCRLFFSLVGIQMWWNGWLIAILRSEDRGVPFTFFFRFAFLEWTRSTWVFTWCYIWTLGLYSEEFVFLIK